MELATALADDAVTPDRLITVQIGCFLTAHRFHFSWGDPALPEGTHSSRQARQRVFSLVIPCLWLRQMFP